MESLACPTVFTVLTSLMTNKSFGTLLQTVLDVHHFFCRWVYISDRKSHSLITPPYHLTSLVTEEEVELKFTAPSKEGNYNFTVCVRSDSYLGTDLMEDIKLDVQKAWEAPTEHKQWEFSVKIHYLIGIQTRIIYLFRMTKRMMMVKMLARRVSLQRTLSLKMILTECCDCWDGEWAGGCILSG